MKKMRKYWFVWLTTAKLSLSSDLATRGASILLMVGKLFRFASFIYFLFILKGNVPEIVGHEFDALVTFFLIFNLFDLIGQIFFRGIYWFRQQVVTGEFDFTLVKPISPLFQALTRKTDPLDIPLLIIVIVALMRNGVNWSVTEGLTFMVVGVAGVLVITAIHIAVAALGVLTTEVDHTMWIYRDLSSMARFPLEIYSQLIRTLLTFVLPIALVFNFPARAYLGILSPSNVVISVFLSVIFLYLSKSFWNFALMRYSSASS